jgi:SAM-dependent methyltransferase
VGSPPAGAIRYLPRVIGEVGPRPGAAGEDHPMRRITRQVAFDPAGWTPARAAEVAAIFDELAPDWHTRDSEPRRQVVADALDRGGPIATGAWLELGSGTGLVTPMLAECADVVVAVDLSAGMLALAPDDAGARVRADGSCLPLADGSLDAVLLVNAFLFPAEVRRVLRPGGAVVWVNTSGPSTPIHLPADDVAAALGSGWGGPASEAAWGTWAVLRNATNSRRGSA